MRNFLNLCLNNDTITQMQTNIMKDKNKVSDGHLLKGVYVKPETSEHMYIQAFFGLTGMKKAFLAEHKGTKRWKINNALESGSYDTNVLKDIRAFIEKHKHEVEEFIKPVVVL